MIHNITEGLQTAAFTKRWHKTRKFYGLTKGGQQTAAFTKRWL